MERDGYGAYTGNIDELKLGGTWLCAWDISGNLPFTDAWFTLSVFAGGTGAFVQIANSAVTAPNITETCIRHYNGEEWSGWAKIATATKPQVYDLPLAAGCSVRATSVYYKTQDGIVSVHCSINFAAYSQGMIIATLPEGYRPTYDTACAGHITGPSGRAAADVVVKSSGNIEVWGDNAPSYLSFFAGFVAA